MAGKHLRNSECNGFWSSSTIVDINQVSQDPRDTTSYELPKSEYLKYSNNDDQLVRETNKYPTANCRSKMTGTRNQYMSCHVFIGTAVKGKFRWGHNSSPVQNTMAGLCGSKTRTIEMLRFAEINGLNVIFRQFVL